MDSDKQEKRRSIYEIVRRDKLAWSRKEAALKLKCIDERRLEYLEKNPSAVQPEDVLLMAEVYEEPSLCNHYCAIECAIGRDSVPYVGQPDQSQLPIIVLRMIASLNSVSSMKDRLIEIAADGAVTDDELEDFKSIQGNLDEITSIVKSLELWAEKAIKKE